MGPVWETALAVLASIGGGAAIVVACSTWLGKVWADRFMANETAKYEAELARLRADLEAANAQSLARLAQELDIAQARTLDTVREKLAAYRYAVDLVAGLVAEMGRAAGGRTTPGQALMEVDQFERERLRLYGYLGMLAPQEVMDAQDNLIDWILGVVEGTLAFDWTELRRLALVLLNEIRRDVGLDKTPIMYRGAR